MDAFLLSGLMSALAALLLIEYGLPKGSPETIRIEDEAAEARRRRESLDD